MMSLSLSEWRELHGIDKALRRSDARLAAMLAIFCRLSASEAMPGHERLGTLGSRAWPGLLLATAAVVELIARGAILARVLVRALTSRPWHCRPSASSSPDAPLSTTPRQRWQPGDRP